ncbi:MAG TPA: phospholipase D-like domain-containing protein [Anaerolineales bacterium]|nr:phospholipase D-like domain-containing protein [Anaerolineales bacterium]HLE73625.1 phospholipase D-like domain-containing protein [Anaerolineales bacterium]
MFKKNSLVLLSALLAACVPLPAPSEVAADEWLAVYFSDPNADGAELMQGGPDEPLAAALTAAEQTIEIAIYDLDMTNIRNALISAAQREVQVRLVIESENFTPVDLQLLLDAGIAVVGDEDPDLMHNKFAIIDRREVWTGSFNYTITDAYGNRNNLVKVESALLVENYLAEFEEMFTQGLFGSASPANTPNPQFSVNGTLVETYFSPDDGVQAHLVDLVDGARESIYFLAYSFTSDELAEALVAAKERGVEIRGVMDDTQAANSGGEFGRLTANDIEVRLDGEGGRLHHKVLIFDEAVVATGSYNFSASAENRNDENSLVIHQEQIAGEFIEDFWRIWELAEP